LGFAKKSHRILKTLGFLSLPTLFFPFLFAGVGRPPRGKISFPFSPFEMDLFFVDIPPPRNSSTPPSQRSLVFRRPPFFHVPRSSCQASSFQNPLFSLFHFFIPPFDRLILRTPLFLPSLLGVASRKGCIIRTVTQGLSFSPAVLFLSFL